jgi:ferrous iron transport protein B
VVVDVIDASNLERNLYLAVQLMELGVPVVLAFNMSDVAKARGFQFDLAEMSRLIGAPIVETVGSRGTGLDELVAARRGPRPAPRAAPAGDPLRRRPGAGHRTTASQAGRTTAPRRRA